MNRPRRLPLALLLASLLPWLAACVSPGASRIDASPVSLTPPSTQGYTRALPGRPLVFPQDHGAHPDFLTEWWYYTGNLADETGRRYGYQLTFFRRALQPPAETTPRLSDWAASQAYMAHFAITAANQGDHRSAEKLARGAAGLAGAQSAPFGVWLEDWQVQELEPGVYSLKAAHEGAAIDLVLRDRMSPVLHGEAGYSQKGPDPGDASYYYSLTDLTTNGQLSLDGKIYLVSGSSWMDHEFSTSALSPGQVGWDWFSIQLDDGRQLMFFQMRRDDGSIDPFSSGTLVYPDGSTRPLSAADFTIQPLDTWKSPRSGGVYPSGWQVNLPGENLLLRITPLLRDQELNLTYDYWEGAVQVESLSSSQPLSGFGYVELTGYAGSMSGEF
jgi:predicted secreted hydrolase